MQLCILKYVQGDFLIPAASMGAGKHKEYEAICFKA